MINTRICFDYSQHCFFATLCSYQACRLTVNRVVGRSRYHLINPKQEQHQEQQQGRPKPQSNQPVSKSQSFQTPLESSHHRHSILRTGRIVKGFRRRIPGIPGRRSRFYGAASVLRHKQLHVVANSAQITTDSGRINSHRRLVRMHVRFFSVSFGIVIAL